MTCAAILWNRPTSRSRDLGSHLLHRCHTRCDPTVAASRDRARRRHRWTVQSQSVSWSGVLNRLRLVHSVRRLER